VVAISPIAAALFAAAGLYSLHTGPNSPQSERQATIGRNLDEARLAQLELLSRQLQEDDEELAELRSRLTTLTDELTGPTPNPDTSADPDPTTPATPTPSSTLRSPTGGSR
jgi:hypothetical protein